MRDKHYAFMHMHFRISWRTIAILCVCSDIDKSVGRRDRLWRRHTHNISWCWFRRISLSHFSWRSQMENERIHPAACERDLIASLQTSTNTSNHGRMASSATVKMQVHLRISNGKTEQKKYCCAIIILLHIQDTHKLLNDCDCVDPWSVIYYSWV